MLLPKRYTIVTEGFLTLVTPTSAAYLLAGPAPPPPMLLMQTVPAPRTGPLHSCWGRWYTSPSPPPLAGSRKVRGPRADGPGQLCCQTSIRSCCRPHLHEIISNVIGVDIIRDMSQVNPLHTFPSLDQRQEKMHAAVYSCPLNSSSPNLFLRRTPDSMDNILGPQHRFGENHRTPRC